MSRRHKHPPARNPLSEISTSLFTSDGLLPECDIAESKTVRHLASLTLAGYSDNEIADLLKIPRSTIISIRSSKIAAYHTVLAEAATNSLAFHSKMTAVILGELSATALIAVRTLRDILTDETASHATRSRAAKHILDYVVANADNLSSKKPHTTDEEDPSVIVNIMNSIPSSDESRIIDVLPEETAK